MANKLSKWQITRFERIFNHIFLVKRKGQTKLMTKRIHDRNNQIENITYFLIMLPITLGADYYNLFNKKYGFFVYLLIGIIFFSLVHLILEKISKKKWITDNKIFSNKLEEYFSQLRKIGLNIQIDNELGQNLYKENFLWSPIQFQKRKYINLSKGLKIESSLRTKIQEQFVKFLQSAKIIENNLYKRLYRYKIGLIIIILFIFIISIVGITPFILNNLTVFTQSIYIWLSIALLVEITIFAIISWFLSSRSKVYVRTLIVQGKLPIDEINLAVNHDALKIYKKIRLGNKIKLRSKGYSTTTLK